MAEIAIAAAVAAAVSGAAYAVQYALTPKAKPIERGRLRGDIQIQDSRYGHMIPILLGANPGVSVSAGSISYVGGSIDTDFKNIDVPPGVQNGDVMLAFCHRGRLDAGEAGPSAAGWTPLPDNPVTAASHGNGPAAWAFRRVANSEPASYDFSGDDDLEFFITIEAYRGVDTSDPIADSATDSSATNGDAIDLASVTTTRENSRLVGFVAAQAFLPTNPSGFTTRHNNLDDTRTLDRTQAETGATGALAFNWSANPNQYKLSYHVALNPALEEEGETIEAGGGMRIAGNVIYMSDVRKVETVTPAEGGKGFGNKNPDTITIQYFCDLAIMFAEGELSLAKLFAGTDLILDFERADATGVRDETVGPDVDTDNIDLLSPSGFSSTPQQRYGFVPVPDSEGTVTGSMAAGGGADFRFYSGSETQLPDPLLEAHFGVGNTPAYLGRSYIVLENFEVGKYGAIPNFTAILNNINLTTAATCLDHLFQRVGLEASDFDVSNVEQFKVRGIPITNREGPRNTVELIGKLFGFDVVETNGEIVCIERGGSPSFAVTEDDLGTVEVDDIEDPQSADIPELITQELELDQTQLPRRVDVTFFDPARNGENNTQGVSRLEALANGFVTEEVNAVLTITEARRLAHRLLDTAWIESAGALRFKVPHTFAEEITAAAVGTVTRSGITHTIRVKEVNGFVPGALEVVGTITRAASYTQEEIEPGEDAGAPVVNPAPSSIPATTVATFIDRLLRDRDLQDGRPGFYVAACSFGNGSWGGANVYVDRGNGYVFLVRVSEQATMGVVDATDSTIAGASEVDVELYGDQTLPTGGVNYVLQGGLIYSYSTATQLSSSPNLWRISGLANIGARCTTAENGSHVAGERFVYLNEALRFVSVENSEIGQTRNYKVPTVGQDINDAGVISFTLNGSNISVTTPADWAMTAGSGSITHNWTPFSDSCVMSSGLIYEIRDDDAGNPGDLIYSGGSVPHVELGLSAGEYTRHFRARTTFTDGAYLTDSVTITGDPGTGVDPSGVSSSYEDFITNFYEGALARSPSGSEMTAELDLLLEATTSRLWYMAAAQLGYRLFTSAEYIARGRTNAQFIGDLYRAYLQREGEPDGITDWLAALAGGSTRAGVTAHFGDSTEFRTVHCFRIFGWRPECHWEPVVEAEEFMFDGDDGDLIVDEVAS